MRLIRMISTLLSAYLALPSAGLQARSIVVRNQAEFDKLPRTIEAALDAGDKSVDVMLSASRLYYGQNHIFLGGKRCPETTLSIRAEGCRLVAGGKDYSAGRQVPSQELIHGCLLDASLNQVDVWSPVYRADGAVKVVSEKQRLCAVSSAAFKPSSVPTHIQLTTWYTSKVYTVSKVEGRTVYFVADDLEKVSPLAGYNVNHDLIYGRSLPRFRVLNAFKAKEPVHSCMASCFIYLSDCDFKSVTIKGIDFTGNAVHDKYLINMYKLRAADVSVSGCTFSSLSGRLMHVNESANVCFKDNKVSALYGDGIVTDNIASNTRVIGNTFVDCGKGLVNSCCVRCQGKDYVVENNTFCNFGYCGISVGLWYKEHPVNPCRGIVKGNELFYTTDYLDAIEQHTLMDSGAIYIYTQNEKTIISENYIHDYSGIKDNRGIFGDDGCCNCDIVGNVILRVPNSYSIDIRRTRSVETEPSTNVKRCNVGNTVQLNIVSSPIRLEGNESGSSCIKGPDFVLSGSSGKSIVRNAKALPDVEVSGTMNASGKLTLDRKSSRSVKRAAGTHDYSRYIDY